MDEQQSVVQQKINKQNNSKNIIVTIVVMIGIFIGIGVWYNNNHYSTAFENNFMTSCEAQGPAASYCSCAYGQLKQQYSYSQAKYFNANPSASDTQAAINSIASQCTGTQ